MLLRQPPENPSDAILRDIFSRYPENQPLDREQAEVLLRDSLSALETAMAGICRRYSKLYLLLMLRRSVSPQTFLGGAQYPLVEGLPLQVLTAVALKHGNNTLERCFASIPLVLDLTLDQEQEHDTGMLVNLAWRYARLVGYWKAHGSGAQILIQGGSIRYEIDSALQALPDLENRRRERNASNLFSPVGSIGVVSDVPDIDWSHPVMLIAAPAWDPARPQLNRPPVVEVPGFHARPMVLNYQCVPFDLSHFAKLVGLYAPSVIKTSGMSKDELILCLAGLARNRLENMIQDDHLAQAFYLTGVGVHRWEAYREWLTQWICRNGKSFGIDAKPISVVRRFLNGLAMTSSRCATINLHPPWIPSILFRFGSYLVIDWASAHYFLVALLNAISRDPEMHNIKGDQFEIDLECFVSSKSAKATRLFHPNQKLRVNGKQYGEADLSFRKGAVGFVVDCKAYSVSLECLRGDEAALKTRWNYTEEWISQVVKTTRILAANPKGDNYALPTDIKLLVPIVCSSHVEPVYDFDDKHFVMLTQPRVCTPFELIDIIDAEDCEAVLSKEYTFIVQGNG